jgi:hypothetical protein
MCAIVVLALAVLQEAAPACSLGEGSAACTPNNTQRRACVCARVCNRNGRVRLKAFYLKEAVAGEYGPLLAGYVASVLRVLISITASNRLAIH